MKRTIRKIDNYRAQLRELEPAQWDNFLRAGSGLPGRRANIELARAVAGEGNVERFERYLALDADRAPLNTPDEFLAFCGVLGLGRLIAQGERPLSDLRPYTSDLRWRMREAVAMAVQHVGRVDFAQLPGELWQWIQGGYLEQRAAVAGVCEPDLLVVPGACGLALDLLDGAMEAVLAAPDRKDEGFRVLRKGLAYCWSVAVASCPDQGRPRFDAWLESADKDVRWIMRENLKKKRLLRLDETWVARSQEKVATTPAARTAEI